MKKFFCLSLFALFFVYTTACIAEEDYKIKVNVDRKDGLYKSGQKINFSITFYKGDKAVVGKKLSYTITRGGDTNIKGDITSKDTPSIITTSINKPGFVLCYVYYKTEAGKYIRAWGGAGVEPLKISTPKVDKKEINAFWDAKIKMLNALPLKVIKTPKKVPERYSNKLECFDIKVNCLGGVPVSGYFIKPAKAKAKSLPAYVSFHGAGWRSASKPYFVAARGVLTLDVNAHGIDNGKPKDFYTGLRNGRLKGYPYFNSDNKGKSYFCGMFMRVYRALQFIKAQPEWDGKTLIVYGSSQGGAQTLFAAAVDPDITLGVARVPAMCNHYGILKKRQSGWPRFIRLDQNGKPRSKAIADCAKYYDVALLAPRIKSEMILTAGFIDRTCSPSSVYAAYNNIKSKKKIINNVESGHTNPRDVTKIIFNEIYDKLK
jgi:cephalosporin-C deacetylase